MSIGVAIIGSGLFAKEQHLPAVQAASNFQLKAIYSRSLKSAKDLASGTSEVDLYSEDSGSGKSYTDLLTRSDIGAVIIALPILVQPEFIRKALLAGKHVLSEKPIAKDVATAQELLQWYKSNIDTSKVFWAVAENFRYMTKFLFAAEQVQKLGKVQNFRVNVHSLMDKGNKYFHTTWRKTPEYQGGFLLDGGVHMTAALRLILGPTERLSILSAQSQLQQSFLPPVDTVDAVAKAESGATGVISLSWGSSFNNQIFEFACEKGVVTLDFDDVTVNGEKHHVEFDGKGVVPEVAEFANSIVSGKPDSRQSPEEALADLEILEQMLRSGEKDGEKNLREKFSRLNSDPTTLERPARPSNTDKMAAAKQHIPIVKKRTHRFNRHQSDRFMRVGASWRKPKGIDNCVRRRFKGQMAMPSIGYGSNKKTRHMMPSGHKAFLVQNPKDVELLLMHNRTFAAEIGHAVSSRKRVEIIEKAKALGVKVTNPKGRVTTEA
ncbi:unnamed protein product [Penicillium nalgiovense]|uniref:Gfo/Idh/MocA-like oxidoreductase N-terminal domain-containing protein n=1 Tax=Penicillium nalgiovense TaxID=60175 RepID=A0A9W4ICC1_PENNA|nr:unnamed protein product [Penicillium nalgiovense]CAG7961312.1 unnamed protein product [Penicillium nalgiovense]CAG7976163.1 unnamed protein product [Penicillium nalgiovense]CAG7985452.1 unnamed protein product [Penicillium nalgiovense]CAG7987528.1 unnamed protein product [Penicillium nalgiovense]